MATFCLIIDGFLAFNLDVIELNDGFYETLKARPKVLDCTGLDVLIGDTYAEGIFYRNDNPVGSTNSNPGETIFAFIVNNAVSFIQSIPNSNEMLVAAYSSDPLFAEIPIE
jgi:hypothetical protein